METMMKTWAIEPLHGIMDCEKFHALVASMETEGWVGRPILAIGTEECAQAITGTHRLYAAREAEIDVPVVLIETDIDWTEEYCISTEVDRRELVEALGTQEAIELLLAEDE